MKLNRVVLFVLITLTSPHALANLDLITWKGIFYAPVPIKKGISQTFCDEHNPGTIIHTTQQTRHHAVVTDKGITLDRITLIVDKLDDIYLLHGDLYASVKTGNQHWRDHIYYFQYKTSEAGTSKGVWNSDKCKGKYTGIAIKNDNPPITG